MPTVFPYSGNQAHNTWTQITVPCQVCNYDLSRFHTAIGDTRGNYVSNLYGRNSEELL